MDLDQYELFNLGQWWAAC